MQIQGGVSKGNIMSVQNFNEMLGVTMRSVTGARGNNVMLFTAENDSWFRFEHMQDCCERVCIEDVIGDLDDLVGSPIVLAEEVSSKEAPAPDFGGYAPESYTWTFYRFGTAKGTVTVRWLGTSNGYYSEAVHYQCVIAQTKADVLPPPKTSANMEELYKATEELARHVKHDRDCRYSPVVNPNWCTCGMKAALEQMFEALVVTEAHFKALEKD